jgi:hypothetical protein
MEILRAKTIEIESLFNFMVQDFPGSWLRSVVSALYQPVEIETGSNALLSSVIQVVQKNGNIWLRKLKGDEKKERSR